MTVNKHEIPLRILRVSHNPSKQNVVLIIFSLVFFPSLVSHGNNSSIIFGLHLTRSEERQFLKCLYHQYFFFLFHFVSPSVEQCSSKKIKASAGISNDGVGVFFSIRGRTFF